MTDLSTTNFTTQQTAKRAIVAIGQPATGALLKVLEERRVESGAVIQTLAAMGPAADAVMPTLLAIASNPPEPNPPGWTWNVSLRDLLLSEVKTMGWAADRWIPVLSKIAQDQAESDTSRQRATFALGGMGAAAEPLLRTMSTSVNADERKWATHALVTLVEARGGDKNSVFEEAILRNPADPNVPEFLTNMHGRVNALVPQPITQRVKAELRKRLTEKPDAETAMTLANIIHNGLSGTNLQFAAPTDSSRSQWDREDPDESNATLAAVLQIAFDQAPPKSDLSNRSGRSLARLRLLQGDWDGMNEMLVKVGQSPVPPERRANLPAPPIDWSNLARDWQIADESMRSGNAAIEFSFEKAGRPLAGAHVLVKRRPEPADDGRRYTGAIAMGLQLPSLETEGGLRLTVERPDRAFTRYGVSDSTGKIRLEGLPAIPIAVEVLVPIANFTEFGRNWDFLMEVAPGQLRTTKMMRTMTRNASSRGGPPGGLSQQSVMESEPVSRQQGPAVVTLKANETTKYPRFVIRPQLTLLVSDWTQVNASDFVLKWTPVDKAERPFDHYELEMVLTAPSQHTDLLQHRAIRSTTEKSLDAQWPVGKDGVGGQRLRPGNIYMFEVRAVDSAGQIVARLPWTRVWVPWPNRPSRPPSRENSTIMELPIHDGSWWRSTASFADGRSYEMRELIPKYLAKGGDKFEYEYVQLGQAWLNCLDGQVDAGRIELERLVQSLPQGNVVRGTARWLLNELAAGRPLPQRLEFMADE
jgi:hypothetical protein